MCDLRAKKVRSYQKHMVLKSLKYTDPWSQPPYIHWSGLTEEKYLHFMGTRAEDLIVINILTVGILLDLAKWEDSKYLVAIAPARLSIAQNARILSNVKLRIGAIFLQQQFPGGSD